MPENHVFVLGRVIPLGPGLHANSASALVGELARSIQLIVLVSGHPDGLGGEFGTAIANGSLALEEHLARCRVELVGNGLVGDGVDDVVVANLEDPVAVDVKVG